MNPCIIFNPVARGEKAFRFRSHLAALSKQCALKPTYAAGAGRALAAEAIREGHDTLIAAGGDGTINEVLNGMGDVLGGFTHARLGVIPLGTINVFAKELGLPTSPEGAWQIIQAGRETRIDLPQAEFTGAGQPLRRYFAQLAGAGLDSRAIELVDWNLKKMVGPLAYVAAGIKALRGPMQPITVSSAHGNAQGELVLIGNGRYYGGKINLFPQADLRDGRLDVTVFPKVNWVTLLRAGWGWLTDQIHQAAGAQTFQADSFTLASDQPKVPFELDGDNIGHLPVKFSVQPKALRMLVP